MAIVRKIIFTVMALTICVPALADTCVVKSVMDKVYPGHINYIRVVCDGKLTLSEAKTYMDENNTTFAIENAQKVIQQLQSQNYRLVNCSSIDTLDMACILAKE